MAVDSGKVKDKLTPDEVNRYWDAYFAVVDMLIISQAKLKELEDKATELGERSGYRADRLRVEADIEFMRAKRVAFNAGRSPITPPDQATVSQLVGLCEEVAKAAAERGRAAAIVQIAARAMEGFKKIQKA